MQVVGIKNPVLCGEPATVAVALELVFWIDGVQRVEQLGFFTCANHRYDFTATIQIRELDKE